MPPKRTRPAPRGGGDRASSISSLDRARSYHLDTVLTSPVTIGEAAGWQPIGELLAGLLSRMATAP
jgi:hypothetical protein